jgi:hypothetical protein
MWEGRVGVCVSFQWVFPMKSLKSQLLQLEEIQEMQNIRRVSELQRTGDVRRGFVHQLYQALTSSGLRVLLDTQQINRGEDISATLHVTTRN